MWRGRRIEPEPWPTRVEAFLSACAMYAGQREGDIKELVEGMSEGLQDAAQKMRR